MASRRSGLGVAALLLAATIAGCGVGPGSPDPGATLCRYLDIEHAFPELSLGLQAAIRARDAKTALALAAELRREVERVPDEPIETTYPTNVWTLARLIQGVTVSYRFGAGLVEKGFLEHPQNEDGLRNALAMLNRGDELVREAEAELRRLSEDDRPRCSA